METSFVITSQKFQNNPCKTQSLRSIPAKVLFFKKLENGKVLNFFFQMNHSSSSILPIIKPYFTQNLLQGTFILQEYWVRNLWIYTLQWTYELNPTTTKKRFPLNNIQDKNYESAVESIGKSFFPRTTFRFSQHARETDFLLGIFVISFDLQQNISYIYDLIDKTFFFSFSQINKHFNQIIRKSYTRQEKTK